MACGASMIFCGHRGAHNGPENAMQAVVKEVLHTMRTRHGSHRYVAVHGRIEQDYAVHCDDMSKGDTDTALEATVGIHAACLPLADMSICARM